jgi:hypothetical protein
MDMDLRKALTAAFELPIIYDSFQPELGKPMEIQWDGFPDRTLHKLEVMARVQFWAAVTLLQVEDIIYASEAHVRGVLECLAHVSYICGHKPFRLKGSPRSRALSWSTPIVLSAYG